MKKESPSNNITQCHEITTVTLMAEGKAEKEEEEQKNFTTFYFAFVFMQ